MEFIYHLLLSNIERMLNLKDSVSHVGMKQTTMDESSKDSVPIIITLF